MDICVVITGFNDEGTIMESIESVLSQSRYPSRIGFAHGPSRDSTEEFAGFYREEFDFVHWDSRINPRDCGLMHLRLGSLSEVETSHVMFVRARCYLYRSALATIHETTGDPDLVLAPVRFLAPNGKNWNWSVPEDTNNSELLRHGPFPPSAVIWRTSLLKEYFGEFQRLNLGPFSTLGWLTALRQSNPRVSVTEEPLVETWDFREGNHDWTRDTYTTLGRLIHGMDDLEAFRHHLQRRLNQSGLERDHSIFDEAEDSGTDPGDEADWLTQLYPMVE